MTAANADYENAWAANVFRVGAWQPLTALSEVIDAPPARHLQGIVAGAVGYDGSNVAGRFETQITEPPLEVDLTRAVVPAQPGPGLGLVISPTGLEAARWRTRVLRRDTVSFPG